MIIDRIVIVSPFTSLHDMAIRMVGPLPGLQWLLRHEYNNVVHLTAITNAARQRFSEGPSWPLAITIVHGTQDEVVPVQMGRALADIGTHASQIEPTVVRCLYLEIKGDHNSILESAKNEIMTAMST